MKKEYGLLFLAILIFISFEIAFDLWIRDASKMAQLLLIIILVSVPVIGIVLSKDKQISK